MAASGTNLVTDELPFSLHTELSSPMLNIYAIDTIPLNLQHAGNVVRLEVTD